MAWIKRNLWFFIGGVVALGLLGAAGFYNYTSWNHNSEMLDTLKEHYDTLKSLSAPEANPGNETVNKIEQAKDQEKQIRAWLDQARTWFAPIAPIPPESPVTGETFSAALHRTIDALQHEAEAAHVQLPPEYGFSFEAERSLVKFSPGSLDALATQLGEVKSIAEVLYGAGVNELDSIQRVHASDDDINGPQSDYIGDQPVTTDQAVMTPYVVTFQSFGPEIARVLTGFAGSHHCFIVKSINVQPGTGSSQSAPMGMQDRFHGRNRMLPPMENPVAAVPGKGGLNTFLKEQLLRVSLEVEIVKLQNKN